MLISKSRRVLAVLSVIAAVAAWLGAARLRAQDGVRWQFENVATPNNIPGCVWGGTLAGFELDPAGRPVVAWREDNGCGGSPRVFWTRKDNGTWVANEFHSERRYQGGALANDHHRMALRPSDGNPFLIYRDTGPFNELNTYLTDLGAFPNGGASTYLEGLVPPQNCAGMSYSLAFASGAASPDWASGLTLCSGGGPVRLDGAVIGSAYMPAPALTVTPDGSRHVLWTNGNEVQYTRVSASGLTASALLYTNVNRNGGEVALQSDASGVLHAVVRGIEGEQADWDRGAVAYITSTDGGTTWAPFEYVDPNDAVAGSIGINSDVSLAVDAAGVPAVTYWRASQELWFARRDGPNGTWTRSLVTVDPTGRAPRAAQVRFDADGRPVVAFYDGVAGMMRLARPVPVGTSVPIDIAVTGDVVPSVAQSGALLTYKFTVSNRGTTNVDDVVLMNTLPAGATFVDATPARGSDGRWALGLLNSGGSTTVTIHARAPITPGEFADDAVASSGEADADPSNNTVSVRAAVRPDLCFVPGAGLAGLWRGDGSANASAGQFDGTPLGAVGYAPAVVGRGFAFDGHTSVGVYPEGRDNLYYPGDGSMTVQAWIATTSATGVIASRYECMFYGCGNTHWFLYLEGGHLVFSTRDNTGETMISSGSRPVNDGGFHHVALVIDRSAGEVRLYVDGTLDAATPYTVGPVSDSNNATTPLVIGANEEYSSARRNFFTGIIDELAVHNRALSESELQAVVASPGLQACGAPPPPPPALSLPDTVTAPATGSAGAAVTFAVSATDVESGLAIPVTCVPSSGSVFPVGTTPVQCSATSARGSTATGSFDVTVTPLHVPCNPLAQADTATTPQDTAVDVPVLDNDIVPAACAAFGMDLASVTQPSHGAVVFDTKLRTLTYTPAPGYSGTDSFTYTITNRDGGSATATVTVMVTEAAVCLPAPEGLEAWWNGEHTATDVVRGRMGTSHGGVSYGPGVNGSALVFDGTTGYLEGQTLNVNDLYPATESFTLSAWVKTANTQDFQVIATKKECTDGCGDPSAVVYYYLTIAGGQAGAIVRDVSGSLTGGDFYPPVGGTRYLADGVFHHIVLVVEKHPDGSFPDYSDIRLYVDGEIDQFEPGYLWDSVRDQDGRLDPLLIGAQRNGDQVLSFFRGSIDDLTIHRRALTAGEIRSAFIQRSTGQCHGTGNQAPVLAPPADRTMILGEPPAPMALTASDADGDTVSYGATGLPPGMGIDVATGVLVGQPGFSFNDNPSVGAFVVTVTASDGSLSDSKTFTISVTRAASAVTLSTSSTPTIFGDPVTLVATVSVPLAYVTPTGTVTFQDNGVSIGTVSLTGTTASLTTSAFAAGTHPLTVTYNGDATFAPSTSSITTQTVTGTTPTNRRPTIANPGRQISAEGATVAVPIVASDPDGQRLTYTATGLPAGLAIDPQSGVIAGVVAFNAAGTHFVQVAVHDTGGLGDSAAFVWKVVNVNRPPVLAQPSNRTDAEGANVSFALAAMDPDGGTLRWTATGLPQGVQINQAGVIAGPLRFNAAGIHTVTISVSDGRLTDTKSFTWTIVNSNRAPQITLLGAQSSHFAEAVSLRMYALDADGDPLSFSATGLPPGLAIDATSGLISGRLAAPGFYSVVVEVNDGSAAATTMFGWYVTLVPTHTVALDGPPPVAADVRNVTLEGGVAGRVTGMSMIAWTPIEDLNGTGQGSGKRGRPEDVTFRLDPLTPVDETWLTAALTQVDLPRDVTVVARDQRGHVHFRIVLKEARPVAWTRDAASHVTELTLSSHALDIQVLEDSVSPTLPTDQLRILVKGAPAAVARTTGGAYEVKTPPAVTPLELTLLQPVPEVLTWIRETNSVRTVTLETTGKGSAPWVPINTYGGTAMTRIVLFHPAVSLRNGLVVAWPSLSLTAGTASTTGAVSIDRVTPNPTVDVRGVSLEGGVTGGVTGLSLITWQPFATNPESGTVQTRSTPPVPVTLRLDASTIVDESWLTDTLARGERRRDVSIVGRTPTAHVHFRVVLKGALPRAWRRDPASQRVVELTLASQELEVVTLEDTLAPTTTTSRGRILVDGAPADIADASGGVLTVASRPPVTPLELTLVQPTPGVAQWIQQLNSSRTVSVEARQSTQVPWLRSNTYQSASVRSMVLFDPARSLRNGYLVAWPSLTVWSASAGTGGTVSFLGHDPEPVVDVRSVTLEGGVTGGVTALSTIAWTPLRTEASGQASGIIQAPNPVTVRLDASATVDESWLTSRLARIGSLPIEVAGPNQSAYLDQPRDVTIVARDKAGQVHFRVVLKDALPDIWRRDAATGRVVELTLSSKSLEIQTLAETVAPVLPAVRLRAVVNGVEADMVGAEGGALTTTRSLSTDMVLPVDPEFPHLTPLTLTLVRPVPTVVSWLRQLNGLRTVTLEQGQPWSVMNTYGGAVIRRMVLFDSHRSIRGGYLVAWPTLLVEASSIK